MFGIYGLFGDPYSAAKHGNLRKVIVTGASQGIGRAIVEELARSGVASDIVIIARSRDKLEDLRKSIINDAEGKTGSVNIFVLAADLSSQIACENTVRSAIDLMGGLDFLILNHITGSRYGMWISALESNDDSSPYQNKDFVQDIFQVNTMSYIWMSTTALKALQHSSPTSPSTSAIAVVSSLTGLIGNPRTAVYSASKHALHGFFDSLRSELAIQSNKLPASLSRHVSITLCAIGATDTEGVDSAGVREVLTHVQFDPPIDAAKAIISGTLAGHRTIYHPPHKVYPMVLLNNFFPDLADYILRSAS